MRICNLLFKKRFTDVHSPSWILHISASLGTPTSKQYTNVKELEDLFSQESTLFPVSLVFVPLLASLDEERRGKAWNESAT